MSNNGSVIFCDGSKGGVGKTIMSIGVTDYYTQKLGKKVVLIETDTSNSDAAKPYAKDEMVTIVPLCLDDADGWIELVNICDVHKGIDVIVNVAARNNEAVASYGETLTGALEELARDFTTYWIINRQRDSIELLKQFEGNMTIGSIHVVRNNHWGAADKFELFNGSKMAKTVEKRGKILDLPDLADRVTDYIYSQRLSIEKAMTEMPIGNKAELRRWRQNVWSMLDSANAPESAKNG